MRLEVSVLVVLSLAMVWPAGADPVTGWRTDGTGRYPQADPPTVWSAEKNVLWAAPMPGWSNATPILVGDRIFVCSEPTTLLCVSAADGKILWQKTNTYDELLGPEELAQARQDREKADQIIKELGPLKKQFTTLRDQLKKAPKDADLRARAKGVKKQVDSLEAQLELVSKWRLPPANPTNGYSSSTPTSDGRNVYVLFGTGAAACYDLEGSRKWVRFIEKPKDGYGHSASPLLAGGKLLVHVVDLVALDTDTGEELWRTKSQYRWGSPVRAKIGDVDVAVTAGGDVVRVSDGRALARGLAKLEYSAPLICENTAYFIEHGGKAVRLPAEAAEQIKPPSLWQTRPKKDRYYASPVFHEGLLYAVNQTGAFSAIDAGSGEVVYEKALELGKGTCYPSVTLAGKYIFVSSDSGTTIVVRPGREYEQVARNTLEVFRSSPVFSGTRLYIRGSKKLYCIGR